MSFDTSGPISGYRDFFNDYDNRVQVIINQLNSTFNFNLSAGSSNYLDFWSILSDPRNLHIVDFNDILTNITNVSQEASTAIGNRYMDYVGMVQSIDQYLCYIIDAFSRIVDCVWSFGEGTIYNTRTGKLLSDGTYEIVRSSLETYTNIIGNALIEMNTYIQTDPGFDAEVEIFGMTKSKVSDVVYLKWKRDNYFVPKIREISQALDDAMLECQKLLGLAESVKQAILIWLPETFKLVAYTGLAFNLNKKSEHLSNKMITFGKGVTTTQIVATNSAKFWRRQILPDQSNRSQCMTEAILTGCDVLGYPGQLKSFIELSWEFMVLKY